MKTTPSEVLSGHSVELSIAGRDATMDRIMLVDGTGCDLVLPGEPAREIIASPEEPRIVYARDRMQTWAGMQPNMELATWTMQLPAGSWQACWCGAGPSCAGLEDFVVPVGIISVLGFNSTSYQCAALADCTLAIELAAEGVAVTDKAELAPATRKCGEGTLGQILDAAGFRNEQLAFDFIPERPGKWRVCFCRGIGGCNEAKEFVQEAGILQVSGAASQESEFVCYLGVSCSVTVLGQELTDRDGAMLVKGECGGPAIPLEAPQGQFGPKGQFIMPYESSSTSLQYIFGVPQAGAGDFNVCLCFGSTGFCDSRSRFRYSAGVLHVRGAVELGAATCPQGQSCTIELQGAFSDFDRVLVVEDRCGADARLPLKQDGVFWAATRKAHSTNFTLDRASRPGSFRLCLCAFPNECDPSDPGGFLQPVGTLLVIGAISSIATVLATRHGVELEVSALVPNGKLTCAVAASQHKLGVAPTPHEVQHCKSLIEECMGVAERLEATVIGPNRLYVPFEVDHIAGEVYGGYAWCYDTGLCEGSCTMPSSSAGAAVPLSAAAVAIDAKVVAGEPFTLTLPFGTPHKTLPDGSNRRVKLVEESCDEPPHVDVPADRKSVV